MMRNIALAGGMGAGKSAVASLLVEEFGFRAKKISHPIYHIASYLWGEGSELDRAKLQDLGTKMREIDEDVWINWYVEHLGDVENAKPVVNDTLRFPNEYWALRKADFVTVRVQCPEAKRVDRLQKIGRIQDLDRLHHVSETALFGAQREAEGIHFDYEIWNDTDDRAHLMDEVMGLVRKLENEE